MGDFNNWNPEKHSMPDGQWKEDPQNYQICPNCFETYNSDFSYLEDHEGHEEQER